MPQLVPQSGRGSRCIQLLGLHRPRLQGVFRVSCPVQESQQNSQLRAVGTHIEHLRHRHPGPLTPVSVTLLLPPGLPDQATRHRLFPFLSHPTSCRADPGGSLRQTSGCAAPPPHVSQPSALALTAPSPSSRWPARPALHDLPADRRRYTLHHFVAPLACLLLRKDTRDAARRGLGSRGCAFLSLLSFPRSLTSQRHGPLLGGRAVKGFPGSQCSVSPALFRALVTVC